MASEPQPGTPRRAVYDALASVGPAALAGEILFACGDPSGSRRKALENALANGVKYGDILREGEERPYRYTLLSASDRAVAIAKPTGAASAPLPGDFTASLGTKCAAVPANRAQGTIEEALRGLLLYDAPIPLDDLLQLLPVGWSRAEAVSGLKEAALDGWANYGPGGWFLASEPPAPRAEDPIAITAAAVPNHMRQRLQEIESDLRELVRDAVTNHASVQLLRALVSAESSVGTAHALIRE